MEWEIKDVNEVLGISDETTARLQRHLSSRGLGKKQRRKQTGNRILKGQASHEVEDREDEYEYEYEYEDEYNVDLLPEARALGHLKRKGNKRAWKKGKRAKRAKKGWKKGKRGKKGKKKGKYNNRPWKKGQGGGNNFYNQGGGVYDYGSNGVVSNTLHNNLFNDNNRRAVCLSPPDPYRTCYTRSEDPNSKLNRDYVDRSGYNFGVKLYKQGYTYVDPDAFDPAYNTPLEPYSKPYTASDEKLWTGSMWITLLQDDTNVNCNSMIAMEEATLKYLYENVGSRNTYEPVCVFVSDSAYDRQEALDGSGDVIESTVLRIEVTYVMKDWFYNDFRALEVDEEGMEEMDGLGEDHMDERELVGTRCRPQDRARCSSQSAINTNVGQYCRRRVSISFDKQE
jgi:hypothetical protein